MQPSEALARIDHNLARVRAALASHGQLVTPASYPDGEVASPTTWETWSVTDLTPSDDLPLSTEGSNAAPPVSTDETRNAGLSIQGSNEPEPVETVAQEQSVIDKSTSIGDLTPITVEPGTTETAGSGEPLQSAQLPPPHDLTTPPAFTEPNQSESTLGNANVDISSEPKLLLWARLKRLVMGQ